MSSQAFICDAIRTPIGRYGGTLAGIRTDDLAALPIKALMTRNPGVDWKQIEDVIYGCANQAGEDNRNVARMAALLAGLPYEVPAVTVNRLCGSGAQAVVSAVQALMLGDAELALAGGAECMSRSPYILPAARFGQKMGDTRAIDMMTGALTCPFGTGHMGVTAENVAALHGISREDQDALAVESHQRATAAGDRPERQFPVAPGLPAEGAAGVGCSPQHRRRCPEPAG